MMGRLGLALAVGASTATAFTVIDAEAVVPLKNAAMIVKTDRGYRYVAGQQDSHLKVTKVAGRLRFVDTGTRELRSIPKSCSKQKVRVGVSAVCKVPRSVSARQPMTIDIWPRLGDDSIDGSALSAAFKLSVLADAGRDVVRGGAGNDFVNGARDKDRVFGGGGRDWIRTGIGNDVIRGGSGSDRLVGVDGNDRVRGGGGNDRVGGGSGSDTLRAGRGSDMVACGSGSDDAFIDRSDRSSECESVFRR
jgi:hypothetical protein